MFTIEVRKHLKPKTWFMSKESSPKHRHVCPLILCGVEQFLSFRFQVLLTTQ